MTDQEARELLKAAYEANDPWSQDGPYWDLPIEQWDRGDRIAIRAIQAGVQRERERCARIAEDHAEAAADMRNMAVKDRDRTGALVHGEAWRVGKLVASVIRKGTDDDAA